MLVFDNLTSCFCFCVSDKYRHGPFFSCFAWFPESFQMFGCSRNEWPSHRCSAQGDLGLGVSEALFCFLQFLASPKGLFETTFIPESVSKGFFVKKRLHNLHLHIFTSAHLHLHIFTSSHLHIYIFTFSHLHIYIFTSSYLHIYIFTSSHLHIYLFTSSDLHIYISLFF